MIVHISAAAYQVPVGIDAYALRVTRTVYVFGKALFKFSTIRA